MISVAFMPPIELGCKLHKILYSLVGISYKRERLATCLKHLGLEIHWKHVLPMAAFLFHTISLSSYHVFTEHLKWNGTYSYSQWHFTSLGQSKNCVKGKTIHSYSKPRLQNLPDTSIYWYVISNFFLTSPLSFQTTPRKQHHHTQIKHTV